MQTSKMYFYPDEIKSDSDEDIADILYVDPAWYREGGVACATASKKPVRLQFQKSLGCGAFATVLQARMTVPSIATEEEPRGHHDFYVDVAVKIVNAKKYGKTKPEQQKHVLRELFALRAASKSPYLVGLLESVVSSEHNLSLAQSGLAMFVMEVAWRGSFPSCCKQNLLEAEVAGVFSQVMRGIEYLHQKQIVHRDLKPDNIFVYDIQSVEFLNSDSREVLAQQWQLTLYRVKVGDFGLSHPTSHRSVPLGVGTPGHVAPELCPNPDKKTGPCLPSADIYSSGILFHDLFYFGEKSYERPDAESPGGVRAFQKNMSKRAFRLFHGLMQENPDLRMETKQILQDPFLVGDENLFTGRDKATLNKIFPPHGVLGSCCYHSFLSDAATNKICEIVRKDYVTHVKKMNLGLLNRLAVELCCKWAGYEEEAFFDSSSVEELLDIAETSMATGATAVVSPRKLSLKRTREQAGYLEDAVDDVDAE